jgi:hypothetical protein
MRQIEFVRRMRVRVDARHAAGLQGTAMPAPVEFSAA